MQAVLRAARQIWIRTERPVDADAIAQATGFDSETTQEVLSALCAKGSFGDAEVGDDRVHSVAAPADIG